MEMHPDRNPLGNILAMTRTMAVTTPEARDATSHMMGVPMRQCEFISNILTYLHRSLLLAGGSSMTENAVLWSDAAVHCTFVEFVINITNKRPRASVVTISDMLGGMRSRSIDVV